MKYHIEFDIDLKRNPYKGLYIALEGIDGSGKTTQVEKITEYFKSKGKKVVRTREPRKVGLIGDIVQKVLQGKIVMPATALQYLFSTERVIHHEELVIPELKKGNVVVTDRCFWSAIVYGILDRTGDRYQHKTADQLLIAMSILSIYHQFIVPDRAFYLKISLETALLRVSKKKDMKEIYEDKKKLKKIIEGYNIMVKRFPKEFVVIDGERSSEEVTQEIITYL